MGGMMKRAIGVSMVLLFVSAAFSTGCQKKNKRGGSSSGPTPTLQPGPGSGDAGSPTAGYRSEFRPATDADWHLTGLWNIDDTPSSVPGGASYSGSGSLNYNNRLGNYDTGKRNSAVAISPVVNLNHIVAPVLKFWCNYETETTGIAWDKRFVRILARDGSVLVSYQLATTGGSPIAGACDASGTWHEHTISLQQSYSYIKVSFDFDSMNGYYNDFAGWFIDDADVTSSVTPKKLPGVTPEIRYTTDFSPTTPGWTFTGLWEIDGSPSSINSRDPYHSIPTSLNFNNGTDFDTGGVSEGEARSPMISVQGGTTASVRFWCIYETETEDTSYDQRFLEIYDANTGLLSESYQLATDASDPGADNCNLMGLWHEHVIPINPGPGSIKVAFRFDSIDDFANDFAGWFVDDVTVTINDNVMPETGPAQAAYATVFDNTTGWELGGLWAVDDSPSSALGDPYYTEYDSLNYNNGNNYDTPGQPNSGTARSPLIDVSFLQSPVMTFKCNYNTDTTETDTDQRWVRILDDKDQVLMGFQLAKTGHSLGINACTDKGLWHEHSLSLDPSWRSVRVEFVFDTVTSSNNTGDGWFIDDLFFDLPDIMNGRFEMDDDVYIEDDFGTKLLRFSTASSNAGYAPLTAPEDMFEFDDSVEHNHIHFEDFVEYQLINESGNVTADRKTGFCFVNSRKIRHGAPGNYPDFGDCRTINPGYADIYGSSLSGQIIDITGLPDGIYTLNYLFDPENKMSESDKLNNTGTTLIIEIIGDTVSILDDRNP